MQTERLKDILARVKSGRMSLEEALSLLRHLPFEAVEGSTIDHHRSLRCGFPEVIFCGGKTERQIITIVEAMRDKHEPVLATRVDPGVAERLVKRFRGARHNAVGRAVFIPAPAGTDATAAPGSIAGPGATGERGAAREPGSRAWKEAADPGAGTVLVVSAGTSDLPVAEEACATAEAMGCRVERLFDVGIAGIHRVISQRQKLWDADAIVAVAGMEGALPGVVAGLTDRPVVAVPTSVGYGASFGGLAALLGMLNSCASGVTVVNIDNGFGGGYAAALIARGKDRPREEGREPAPRARKTGPRESQGRRAVKPAVKLARKPKKERRQ